MLARAMSLALPPARVLARLALLGALLAGCRSEPAPDYVRLRGPAPIVPGVASQGGVLVVFWASWCPPCRAETPQLRALAEAPPSGLAVKLFSHDTGLEDIERYFAGPAPQALQLELDAGRRAAQAFGVEQLPVSILVVDGQLVARFEGPRDWSAPGTRRLLERLIRTP